MPKLWKRHPRKRDKAFYEVRYLSVLDLGASSVKALVVERSGNQAIILGHGQGAPAGHHPTGIAADGTIGDMDALRVACEAALCEAEDATEVTIGQKIVPDVALIAVPTAWLRGAMGSGSVHRVALEDSIDAEECYEPVARAGRRAMRNLGRVLGAGTWELADATLIAYSIDGNRVTDPVGFRGHSLEATAFALAAPRKLLDLARQLADDLHLEPPYLVAEPLALAAVCPGDGLIVEVGAQTTELILTRYGVPLAFGHVLGGGAAWTRKLASTFDFSPDRAEILKRAYSAGQLSADGTSAVGGALEPPLKAWLSAVTEYLRSWDSVPLAWAPNIYLCGGASALPGVREQISEARWLNVLPFPHTPTIWEWDSANLPQVSDRTGLQWNAGDVVTLSLAAWAIRDRGDASPDGMLRESLGID